MKRMLYAIVCVIGCSSSIGETSSVSDAEDSPEVEACKPVNGNPKLCTTPSFVVSGLIYPHAFTCDATADPILRCYLNPSTSAYCCRYGNE